jgi:hypothetical protein
MPTAAIIRTVGIQISSPSILTNYSGSAVILEQEASRPVVPILMRKTRRNSTDLEDIFIAHVSGMDMFARALFRSQYPGETDYLKMRASVTLRLIRAKERLS